MLPQKLNRTLFIADNLPVLRGIDSESIDLIATDPPFNKGVKAFEGITAAGVNVEYKDVWTWGDVQAQWVQKINDDHPALANVIHAVNAAAGDDMGAFLCWLGVPVLEKHRVLKPTGSLYLHIDHTAHAYVKAMMDAIFGRKNFRNEVVWTYGQSARGAKAIASQFARNHDIILLYSKGANSVFNRIYVNDRHSVDKLPSHIRIDKAGAYKTAPRGDYTDESVTRLEAEGRIYRTSSGNIRIKYPLQIEKGFVLEPKVAGSSWADIPDMMHAPKSQRTGYPTQKPVDLYERMIKASSNPGDVVLDPFAGCATTCVAAESLGRQWIGIDINEEAGDVLRTRLQAGLANKANWGTVVKTITEPPKRTDAGKAVAPELVVVSRKRNAPRLPVREIREQLLITDGKRCQGCGWEPPYADYLQVDHKKPRSLGGTDDMDNRTLLCDPCNRLKSNKLTLTDLRDVRVQEGRVDVAWWAEER